MGAGMACRQLLALVRRRNHDVPCCRGRCRVVESASIITLEAPLNLFGKASAFVVARIRACTPVPELSTTTCMLPHCLSHMEQQAGERETKNRDTGSRNAACRRTGSLGMVTRRNYL